MIAQPQNIAILGAGIMGLSAACALAEDGHTVTLFDPAGFPTQNASPNTSPNASALAGGMLAPYSEIEHMSGPWTAAGLSGIAFWQRRFPALTHRNGSLLIAHKEDHHMLERFRAHLPPEKRHLRAVQPVEPGLSAKLTRGLLLEEEAHLDPAPALKALVAAAKDRGAALIPEAASPDDLTTKFDHIIDCRGLGAAKDDPDLRGVKGETLTVRNPEFTLSRPVRLMHPRYPLYIVPRDNNVFMIGATMIESSDEQITLRSGLELMSALYALHTSFGEAEILKIQAGIRPAYPDNLPQIKTKRNVISCNGLFRHGFLLAPVMAEALADYLAGRENPYINLFMKGAPDEDHHKRPGKKLHSAA